MKKLDDETKSQTPQGSDVTTSISKLLRRKIERSVVAKFILSIGIGILIALFFIVRLRMGVLRLTSLLDEALANEALQSSVWGMTQFHLREWEAALLLFALCVIFIAPFVLSKGKKIFSVVSFIVLVFSNFFGLILSLAQGDIGTFQAVLMILLCIQLVWISISGIEVIYQWLTVPKAREVQVDVAKLTLVWAVIVFILGLILRG